MMLTLPVLLYQLLFVLTMYVASRFGNRTMTVTLVLCLLWTATHVFFPPLMTLQAAVIVLSYVWFRRRHKGNPNQEHQNFKGREP